MTRKLSFLAILALLSGATAARADAAFEAYKTNVRATLARTVLLARGFPRNGSVGVHFVLDRDGHMSNVAIDMPPNGDSRLRALTMRTVTQAGPFPPFPASVARDQLSFAIKVRYRVSSPRHQSRKTR